MPSGLDLILPSYWPISFAIIWVLVVASVVTGRINLTGALAGGLLSMGIFVGGGWNAFSLLVTFFVLGTAATQWRFRWKVTMEVAQSHNGKRGVMHVVANGGVAGTCGLLGWLIPEISFMAQGMAAASLASALADTVSSELGNVYGSRFFNILNFKREPRGEHGVISPEGTLFGFLGSAIIALQYGLLTDPSLNVLWVFIAGISGNLLDSILGASAQRKGLINNHEVNILNTLFGGVVFAVLYIAKFYLNSGPA